MACMKIQLFRLLSLKKVRKWQQSHTDPICLMNSKSLDSPVVNAFAVPGGYVYFTRGIMGHFNNEAEFAGVLGHEIGHITAKHAARQQRDQFWGKFC
jgi:predicted Zn-dependent protease